MNILRRCFLSLFLLGASASGAVSADGDAGFRAAFATAYGHVREAAFYARRGNPSAAFELEAARDAWAALVTAYGGNPPPAYRKDKAWRATLDAVGGHIDKANADAAAGDLKRAWDRLKPVPDILAELRQRNGVVVFADHVAAANKAFRHLFHYRRQTPDFADAAQVKDLRGRLTSAISAYENCRDKAPADVAGDPQFQRLIKDSLFYLDRMHVAIEAKNALGVVNILRRVISSDNLLWLRFG